MNVSTKLKHYIPEDTYGILLKAAKKADEKGQILFLVGGIVRDLLLGRPNTDLDLVVENDATTLAREIATEADIKINIYNRFNTAKLIFPGFIMDITTSRKETYRRPGALPTVQPGSIIDDLFRRDFTINSIGMYLNSSKFGEILDPFGGIKDLELKLVRILHDHSFIDDATRIFRAIRYQQRLSFNFEGQTLQCLKQNVDMLATISADRIKHELNLVLNEDKPENILNEAQQLGILKKIYPALKFNKQVNNFFQEARNLPRHGALPVLYLCLLIYNFDNNDFENFLKYYKFTRTQIKTMQETLDLKSELKKLNKSKLKPYDIYQILSKYSTIPIQANLLSATSTMSKQRIHLYLTKLHSIKLHLSGKDLIAMGIPQGPLIGEILNNISQLKINGNISCRNEEKTFVYKIAKRKKILLPGT